MPTALEHETVIPCVSQEFVDTYGTYDPLPKSVKAGGVVHVAGALSREVRVGAVGIAHLEDPRPLAPSELNKRRHYPLPAPAEMFWPHGYQTRIELKTTGQNFAIDVPVLQRGLVEISVWAQFPGEKDFAYVSIRTLRVE